MLLRNALIGLTALGIVWGSGATATAAVPVGLQGLPTLQERAATAEPVHFRKRRHAQFKRFVHPRRFHRRHALRRHHFVQPRFHHRRLVRPHHFTHRRHFRARPHFSFGLRFGH